MFTYIFIIIIIIILILFIYSYNNIHFIKKKDIGIIFYKNEEIENYLKNLNMNNFYERMNSNEYITYQSNVIDFTNKEKLILLKNINKVKIKKRKYNRLKNTEWNIIKVRDTLENGNPFTLDRFIFLQSYLIKDKGLEELLLHEYFHIDQRKKKDFYNNLYKKYLEWDLLEELELNDYLKSNMVNNPDGMNNKWYFNYNQNKIIPFLVNNNGNYIVKYYIVNNHKIDSEYNNKKEIDNYLINKYNIRKNYYHPNEIIATILSEHIINNKKIDKKLIHFIN